MGQLFHPRTNTIARVILVGAPLIAGGAVAALAALEWTPYRTRVDVVIDQPVPFSHQHHVAGLGIDCRYCHTTVEDSAFAGMPTTQTCMNCHSQIWTDAALLAPVRESLQTNRPIRWTRVHDLPDYVYFDHSIHVAKGVACVTCHGRVDQMPLPRKTQPMTMAWCLECHRDPQPRLGPRDAVFDMNAPPGFGAMAHEQALPADHPTIQRRGLTNCTVCHR